MINLGAQPILVKILCFAALYIAHGRPFDGIADYGFALLAVYLLLFGVVRDQVKPIFVVLGLSFLTLGHFVPQLAIPEQERLLLDSQHNYIPPGEFLKNAPKYPYFLTADGYVQGHKNMRFVRTIDIDKGILSLRSGWMNRPEYNFFAQVSPLKRPDLPFVVCYEIIPQLVGMTLTVEGLLVFEREGRFKIHDPALKTLQIQEEHAGSILCGFGGQWDEKGYNNLTIKLKKTFPYKVYDAARSGSFFLGLALLFFGLFFIRLTRDFGVQSLLLSISAFSFWLSLPNVFRWGIFARGGMDGIIHDGFPYQMLEMWATGDWVGALMSPERVFYFMPGMRYVRFLEMLLFGDVYIFQVCLYLFMPIIFYRFFSVFLTQITALVLSLLTFAHLFNGIGLSLKLYLTSLLDLYGEGVAYALLFISITLLVKSIRTVGWGFLAFFLSAISISIRPNLAVFFGIIGTIHLFTTTFSTLPWTSRFVMLFGLSPVLLIPIHNILGGEFVLVSQASQIAENLPLTPFLYYQALTHLLGLNDAFQEMGRFVTHFKHVYPQYILAWVVLLWLTIKAQMPVVRAIALATFSGLSVHFFCWPTLRYLHPYLTIAIVLGLSQIPRLRAKEAHSLFSKES